jgi:hypothetical protein
VPMFPTSALVDDVQREGIPPDTIVVRGYLGTVDPLDYANRLLVAAAQPQMLPSNELLNLLGGDQAPGRIYLSARLDRWIEIDDGFRCILRVFTEQSLDRLESYVVWLRKRDGRGQRIRYRVVTVEELDPDETFVAGRLVEDYMSRGEASNVVWDEQQYGPTTGKKTGQYCF